MITSLHMLGFKNFESEALRIGPFTLVVGANASGKSNIRDAFRFLHGLGRGYTLSEIVGGKYIGGQPEWGPIRGAPREVAKLNDPTFALGVNLSLENLAVNYFVGVGPEILGDSGFRIYREELKFGDEVICDRTDEGFLGVTAEFYRSIEGVFRIDQPILTQLYELPPSAEIRNVLGLIINAFKNMRFLDLAPDRMRDPSILGQTNLGDRGENLPTVLQDLCSDPAKKKS